MEIFLLIEAQLFTTNVNDEEDVAPIDAGFGSRKPTPEERIET